MKYRTFGKMKWEISEIGFGAWAIGGDMWGPQSDAESVKALHRAVDNGLNFIDTAQGYGDGHSEEIIGKVLKERSEEIYVATKVPPIPGITWPPPDNLDVNEAFPAEYIINECEKSLKRLDREFIDVYQFHTWAAAFNLRDELFEALEKLKEQGKIRASGASVPDTKPDSIIGALVKGRIDAVQVIYNIFEQYPRFNLLPTAGEHDIGIIVRVPFDEGALTGKYTEGTKFPEKDMRNNYFRGGNLKAVVKQVDKIDEFRKKKIPELTMPELALKFCLSHPNVTTVIPGIRNTRQADMNTSVSDGEYLSEDMLKEIEQFYWRKDFWFNEEKV